MGTHILHAFELDGNGGAADVSADVQNGLPHAYERLWVHLDANQPETAEWLNRQELGLDPLVINALLALETRPSAVRHGEGFLLNLRGVNLNENADPEDMVSIRLWVTADRIISVRLRKLRAVTDVREALLAGTGPKNLGSLITSLALRLLERMGPTLYSLEEALDDLEEDVIEEPDSSLSEKITSIRKKAIMFRRYMAPQKEALAQMRELHMSVFDHTHLRHLEEAQNKMTRYIEDLDAQRERAQVVKDEFSNYLAQQLNHNLYILSIVSFIFLPLGFLTGVFGINLGGMPGAESGWAFYIFCLSMVGLVALQIFLLKKFKLYF